MKEIEKNHKKVRALLLKGPIMSKSQFQSFLKTRESFETWRKTLNSIRF